MAHSPSTWTFDYAHEQRIASLSASLHKLRPQHEQWPQELDVSDCLSGTATDRNCTLAKSRGRVPRIKFLDRFAELLAREKNLTYVSCVGLEERENSAAIYISRNGGFNDFDRKFLNKLEAFCNELAGGCT